MAEIVDEHGGAVEVVDGNVEIALNLRGMEVESEGTTGSSSFEEVGDKLCGYRDAGLIFAVLAGVAVVRKDGGDTPRRSALKSVDHEEQFEQVIVDGIRAGLHDKDVGATDIFEDLEIDLAVAEAAEDSLSQRDIEMLANRFGEAGIRGATEDFESLVVQDALARSPLSGDRGIAMVLRALRRTVRNEEDAARLDDRCAFQQARVPGPRNCFANEGLIVRKPDNGSARLCWARENTKHRRTATSQQGS